MPWVQFLMHWLKFSGQVFIHSFPFASLFFFIFFIVCPSNDHRGEEDGVIDAIIEELEAEGDVPKQTMSKQTDAQQ